MRLIHLSEFAAECKVSTQSVRKAADRYHLAITKGMVDADSRGAISYRTHVTTQRHVAWHDKSTRKQKLETKAAARTAGPSAAIPSTAPAGPVSLSAEQRDDEPREYLTHLEVVVLVNDVAALLAASVECDVMNVSLVPGQKTPIIEPEQLANVKRIVKAVRSESSMVSAEKKVVDILRAITKKTLADMKELNVFFRHYCMELEDRFTFYCRFKPGTWDAIETTSDEVAPDGTPDPKTSAGPDVEAYEIRTSDKGEAHHG